MNDKQNILNWQLYFVEPAGGGTAGQATEVGFWKIQFLTLSNLKQIPATIKKSCQCNQGYLTPWCKHQQLITRVGNFDIGNSTDQLCWRGATNDVNCYCSSMPEKLPPHMRQV